MTPETHRYDVPGMVCRNCADTVSAALTSLDGVGSVEVDLAAGAVSIATSAHVDIRTVQRALDDVGYTATPDPSPQPPVRDRAVRP